MARLSEASSSTPPPTPVIPSMRHFLASADTAVTGRKIWKTLKTSKDEIVWPPVVEAALIEGLEIYKPRSGNDPARALLRFPRRNRFISEHILRTTGKQRTAKQVGSRLQQLRDTCGDSRIKKLIVRDPLPPLVAPSLKKRTKPTRKSKPRFESNVKFKSKTTTVSQASPSPPSSPSQRNCTPEIDSFLGSPVSRATTTSSMSLHDILPDNSIGMLADVANGLHLQPHESVFCASSSPSDSLSPPCRTRVLIELNEGHSSTSQTTRQTMVDPKEKILKLTGSAPLWAVQPTVAFVSPKLQSHFVKSTFSVLINEVLTHAETTTLDLQSPIPPYVYKTDFIPGFWSQLCLNSLLNQCTVKQDVTEITFAEGGGTQERMLLSVVYRFEDKTAPTEPASSSAVTPSFDFSHTSGTPGSYHSPESFHASDGQPSFTRCDDWGQTEAVCNEVASFPWQVPEHVSTRYSQVFY